MCEIASISGLLSSSMVSMTPQPMVAPAGEFTCAACAEAFLTGADQRVHAKSERHLYNTKRRLANLKPISQEAWERKLKETRTATDNKGKSHLKPGKEVKKGAGGYGGSEAPSDAPPRKESETTAPAVPEEPLTPCHSLFDRKESKTMEDNIAYMQKKYGFFIPDVEYCTDMAGLITFLCEKISEPPHACICCNRGFPDLQSVRRHMIDTCHTRIGSEARTRRGGVDKDGSEQLQAELEDFYDYHGSTREITERMRKPEQKVASLVRYFDKDKDGKLKRKELAKMWAAMSEGAELSDEQWEGACGLADVEAEEGFDAEALHKIYKAGLADLNQHFSVLQDLLSRRKPQKPSKKDMKYDGRACAWTQAGIDMMAEAGVAGDFGNPANGEAVRPAQLELIDNMGYTVEKLLGAGLIEVEELAQAEVAEEEAGKDTEKADAEGDEDDETDSNASDETDVIECEDEDEFAEVMRVLGLQKVQVQDNGDLVLPNGKVATHRDVQHIYKQRGVRMDEQQLSLAVVNAAGHGERGKKPIRTRAQLMLANCPAGSMVAISQRQQSRQDKSIIAIMRSAGRHEMKVRMQQNLLQTQNRTKISTGMGDMSGGR